MNSISALARYVLKIEPKSLTQGNSNVTSPRPVKVGSKLRQKPVQCLRRLLVKLSGLSRDIEEV